MLGARDNMADRAAVGSASEPELLLLRHHPELRNRPEARPGRIAQDARAVALSWNVFQTLALVSPPFWLRRLRARLLGLSSVDAAPQVVEVGFWRRLPAPGQPDRSGTTPVDVLVETEGAVYGFLVCDRCDLAIGDSSVAAPDPVLSLVDAVSWHAGVRESYVGLLTSDAADAPVASALFRRYASSRDTLARRLPHRRDGLRNVAGMGCLTWRDLASILRDCAGVGPLDDAERYLAGRTLRWLASVGIQPAD